MRFRTRLIILFLIVGLIPLIVATVVSLNNFRSSFLTYQNAQNDVANEYLTREVKEKVATLSSQISQYIFLHPEISMADRGSFPNNQDLALFSAQPIGKNGYTFVYDLESTVIYHPDLEMVGKSLFQTASSNPEFWRIVSTSLGSSEMVDNFYYTTDEPPRLMYMAVQRVPDLSGAVDTTGATGGSYLIYSAAVVDVAEFLGTAKQDTGQNQVVIVGGIAIAVGLGLFVLIFALVASSRLATPIEWMAFAVTQMLRYMESSAQNLRVPENRNEVKFLSSAIALLSKQIREQVSNLEEMVKDRTAELTRRTAQVETAAQVARESAEILDVNRLLEHTTQLISERFGFYHAGIFLLDQAGEFAILRAANSEGGKRMLAHQHKLRIGQGVVGYVAARGEPRIVLDVGEDAVHFKNPDLSSTRSELALPLRVRTRVIGVLDVQSTDPGAYTEEDTRILQVLADQLALAIDNARLYRQTQQTLRELETAYGQQARDGWQRRLSGQGLQYAYDRVTVQSKVIPDDDASTIPLEATITQVDDEYLLSVPMLLRNQPLGTINLRREITQSPWSEEEVQVVNEVASQIASTLENARLLDEIGRRARQESLLSQFSAKVQTSLDLETVLTTAIREIGLTFSASRVEVDLEPSMVPVQPEHN